MYFRHFKSYTTEDFINDEEFIKFFQEEANGTLDALIRSLPEKQDEIVMALKILRGMKPGKFHQDQQKKRELWNQILQGQKKKIRLQYFRYAASILLVIGLGSAIFFLSTGKTTNDFAVNKRPAENSRLVLANGKTLIISRKQSKIQCSSDGSNVVVNDSLDVAQTVSEETSNQLIVPFGKRSFITLSDGTKVWLNSGSKLTFPSVFNKTSREVALVGEAFFEVTKDQARPFFVKMDTFKLKVYGTKFDVEAYEQDRESRVVLVEGKVSMNFIGDKISKEVFLAPSQKATLSKGHGAFEITNIENIENYTAWMDGYLTFTNEKVAVVLKRVSRYYNAEIEVEALGHMETIYGKLDLKDDLERVLDGIAFISETKYTKQGDKYIFKLN